MVLRRASQYRWRVSGGLLLLTLTAFATPSWAKDRVPSTAFDASLIREHVSYLASNELRGRGSGEPGNDKAAQFLAREFARYGLKPIGTRQQRNLKAPLDGSGYYQPFMFLAGRAVGGGNRMEAEFQGKRRTYRVKQEFDPSSVSGGGHAEGEVVFVGYGIRAPQANRDDYAGADVKGKIVLLLAGSPGNDPHGPLFEFSDIRRKALTARELGATAVLTVLPKDSDALDRSPFDFADSSDAGLPVLRLRRAVASPWFGKDTGGDPLIAAQADADTGKSVARSLGVQVRLSADVKKVEKTTANLVGLLEGSDPLLKDEYVVIGAHMDHLGMGGPGSLDRSRTPTVHHGADDNASGTAGVLALARYFAGQPLKERPKRSLVFACFSGEEMGLLGSAHYVKQPPIPLTKTVAMLNMDMIGRLRENKLAIIGSGTAQEWPALLEEANRNVGLALSPSESGFGASDQQSFYTKDLPVLFFFTGTHPEYHTSADTADKINAEGEAKVLQLVAECATRIADNPLRPTFQRLQVADNNAPSRGFRVYFGSIPDYAAGVEGVQLTGVREGSPAEKAGLKAGDIIVRFGEFTVKSVQDYTLALQNYKPGDKVKVTVKRGTETVEMEVTLTARRER